MHHIGPSEREWLGWAGLGWPGRNGPGKGGWRAAGPSHPLPIASSPNLMPGAQWGPGDGDEGGRGAAADASGSAPFGEQPPLSGD